MHVDEGTIHAWLDGELPASEVAVIEAHVASCATCAAAVAEARGLVAASSRILGALDDVPGGVTPKVMTRPSAAPRARRRWWRPQYAAAAAVLIVVASTMVVYSRSTPSSTFADSALQTTAAEAPAVAMAPPPERGDVATSTPAPIRERVDAPGAAGAGAAAARARAEPPGDEAKVASAAAVEDRRATEADRSPKRSVADAVVSNERERLVGEQRVQLAAPAPAAAPPATQAVEKAAARNEVTATTAVAGGRALSRDAAMAATAPPPCYDLQRSAAAVSAGVPAFVQLMEMPGPTVGGRVMRVVVSPAGAGWFWYRVMDGGLFLARVVDGAVAYEVRFTGIGASDVVGTGRACVTR